MSKKRHPVRPEALEVRTNVIGPQRDALIDEALSDLSAGAPREGFRGRVIARITAAPEPAPIPGFEIFGWRVRSFQVAAVGVVAALGLIAALMIPSLFRQAGPKPAETAMAARKPAATSQPAAMQQMRAVQASDESHARRPAVRRAANAIDARATVDESSAISWVKVDSLPDPKPIVNHAIEIRPVEIQQLAIPEIDLPPLDAGRKTPDNK